MRRRKLRIRAPVKAAGTGARGGRREAMRAGLVSDDGRDTCGKFKEAGGRFRCCCIAKAFK